MVVAFVLPLPELVLVKVPVSANFMADGRVVSFFQFWWLSFAGGSFDFETSLPFLSLCVMPPWALQYL